MDYPGYLYSSNKKLLALYLIRKMRKMVYHELFIKNADANPPHPKPTRPTPSQPAPPQH